MSMSLFGEEEGDDESADPDLAVGMPWGGMPWMSQPSISQQTMSHPSASHGAQPSLPASFRFMPSLSNQVGACQYGLMPGEDPAEAWVR